MNQHPGCGKHDPWGARQRKQPQKNRPYDLKGDFGGVKIARPCDRNGEFEPQMVRKNQTRWSGFDDKILSMLLTTLGDETQILSPDNTDRSLVTGSKCARRAPVAFQVEIDSRCLKDRVPEIGAISFGGVAVRVGIRTIPYSEPPQVVNSTNRQKCQIDISAKRRYTAGNALPGGGQKEYPTRSLRVGAGFA